MERNDAITTLEELKANCSILSRDYQALDYAISSLKTDEAYQLMYEGGEIFTKADLKAILVELQLEIEKKSYYDTTIIGNYEDEVRIYLVELDDVNDIIQQKINALGKDKDE